jgi:hypothetical protein
MSSCHFLLSQIFRHCVCHCLPLYLGFRLYRLDGGPFNESCLAAAAIRNLDTDVLNVNDVTSR